MTKGEGQRLAARLIRIWEPPNPVDIEEGVAQRTFMFESRARRVGMMRQSEMQTSSFSPNPLFACWLLSDVPEGEGTIPHFYVNADSTQTRIHLFNFNHPAFDERSFERDYLPFFRRGCWLSGFDIEASMHEKAEWIQGFTNEEIESWKLKT